MLLHRFCQAELTEDGRLALAISPASETGKPAATPAELTESFRVALELWKRKSAEWAAVALGRARLDAAKQALAAHSQAIADLEAAALDALALAKDAWRVEASQVHRLSLMFLAQQRDALLVHLGLLLDESTVDNLLSVLAQERALALHTFAPPALE